MKILFDGVFNCNPKSGIHRYFFNLIKYIPNEFKKYSSSSVTKTQITNHYIPYFRHFRPHRLSFSLEYLWFRKMCFSEEVDLIHSAYYNLSQACRHLLAKGIPHIITVHDLIHELFDEQENQIRETRQEILQNAKAIVSVSNNTKIDLLNIYPSIAEDKVFVIHHGLDADAWNSSENNENELKYLLYVGHREGYKNFKILVPTLKQLRKKYALELIVVGPKPSTIEKELIGKYNLESHIKFYGEVTDEKLSGLYSRCLAFVYPSLYEGFGYPIIESMSKGAIPIASKTSCMPEVIGQAGIIVEPNCSNSIVEAVCKIIENESFRKSLKTSSIKRSKDFSWKKNVKETISLYERVLSDEI